MTGRLTRTAAEAPTGVANQTIAIRVAAPGRSPVLVASARTAADGTYRAAVPLRVSGALTASYAGTAVLPAGASDLGEATVGNWATTTTLYGTRSGTSLTLSGTVTRTYADATEAAPRVRATIWFTATGSGTPARVASVTTSPTGAFAVRLTPRPSGSYTATVSGVVGHAESSSGAVASTGG